MWDIKQQNVLEITDKINEGNPIVVPELGWVVFNITMLLSVSLCTSPLSTTSGSKQIFKRNKEKFKKPLLVDKLLFLLWQLS